ncbi:GNAT family N-acetyltransferase [Plastoroseomonas hellenica]|uniref:GNAT family N-acetyltransferase n=1 Tax=Plastoroseomonas hellenica TaxID=2687306 RepID=UPI001BA75810|nr:GNAT family N-acetyltransferase [Plastoroseomonas hellenica]MBR0641615.1 GNAT family N-acetyltransferase [Plastoroseomonas hellenica]
MIEIRRFDPEAASAPEWAAFHDFRHARAAEDETDEPLPSDAEFEQEARRAWPLHENRRHIALHGAEVVGVLGYAFRRPGTPDAAEFAPHAHAWGGVLRPWRRQGIATALLRPLLAFLDERGKTTVTVAARRPEGHAFLGAIGAVEKQRVVENRLSLDALDWAELARWEAAAAPAGSTLRWEVHAGRVPLDRFAALMPQLSALFADVPLGALDLPAPRYEMAGYVAYYEKLDRYGGAHLMVLLMDGETVAGMTEAGWDARVPERVFQMLTAVAHPWRGQGLAKGLKAAMLHLVRQRHPKVAMMTTTNAEMNAPMLSINRRLGFAPHRHSASYQISRDALANWLATR